MNLEKYILISNSRKTNSKVEDKILSDVFEAIIGAVYLDKGFNVVEKFILSKEYT